MADLRDTAPSRTTRSYLRRCLLLPCCVAAAGCGSRSPAAGTPLPPSLGGLPLVEIVSGTRASRVVARLHGKDVAPDASWIGRYEADGDGAIVYVSRYRSPDGARAQLDAMGRRIGDGSGEFGHHRTLTVTGRIVHAVLSPGAVNYFFVRDTDLLWLTIAPPRARAALADALGVPPDSIPTAPPLGTPRPLGG